MGESTQRPKLLLSDITKMVDSLPPLSSPEHNKPCIYKVPDPLRKLNEEAYAPQVISIGPFQIGNEKLQIMEEYKLRYLKSFMERVEINFENLIRSTEDSETSVREHYAENIPFSSKDFLKMILIDASFIIELFWRNWFTEWKSEDVIVLKPWFANRMQLDFILLENQLPFFIIDKLFDLAFPSKTGSTSFVDLTFKYFHFFNRQKKSPGPKLEILHFVDLLRNFYLPLDLESLPKRESKMVNYMYGATQLHEIGLKFEVISSSNPLLDLDLDEKKGVLKMPRFILDDGKELEARNLVALEQCYYPHLEYVTDYFLLLRYLIKTEKDVDLLARKGILVNGLASNVNSTFINSLGKSIVYSSMNSKYYKILDGLIDFYEKPSHGLKASLKKDYFRTPWMGAATLAAIFLLILTSVQTVLSILSA